MSEDKKVDVNMLSGIKEAERSLKKEAVRKLEDAVPDGHILKDEVDRQKALMGDIADLPPGHPLVRMLVEAKERYETKDEREDAQTKTSEVRKAKKIEKDRERRERESQRIETEKVRKEAAKSLNAKMDVLTDTVRSAYEEVSGAEAILSEEPVCKAKVMKLKRLLFALERGVSECRITRVS